MKIKKVNRYYADGCNKGFWTKKSCLEHEKKCHCWKNPKNKTCRTCKHGVYFNDSDDYETGYKGESGWVCKNKNFDYDEHFTQAHEAAPDLCINCPLWECC